MTNTGRNPRAQLAPEYRAFMERQDAAAGPPINELSVAEARQFMRDSQQADISRYPVVAERHPVDDFSVLVLRSKGYEAPLPVIVYLHGGGWVLGDAETHARMVREIALATHAAVVFVEYRRAPEAQFPQPLDQCYRALEWIQAQGHSLGLDQSRIAVAGDSAGGNLAAALCLLAAQRGGPAIRFQALLYPVTDCDFDTASYREFSAELNLDSAAMRWYWDYYAPDDAARQNPLASPLRASDKALRGLSPALVITAECDVLRDEGEAYARRLAAAGVPVVSARFGGVLHGFMVIDELARTPQAEAAMRLLASELSAALE